MRHLNKLFVVLYKLLGFAALTLIFLGLSSYLATQSFYLLSHRWVSPAIVSAFDERVLRLDGEIAEKWAERDRLALERSRLQIERDEAARQRKGELKGALDEALTRVDASLKRYDDLLMTLRTSPWLAPLAGDVPMAFVPYGNLKHAREGASVYRCRVGLFVCRKVGTVGKLFDGEATIQHPIRSTLVRGVMVQIQLKNAKWARDATLYLGGPPVLF